MFSTVQERTFNLFLEQLNSNTKGVVFDGNFMFKATNSEFKMYKAEADSLEIKETNYCPVADAQMIEQVYISGTEKVSMTREFFVTIPAHENPKTREGVFDNTSNEYQALLEVLTNLKGNFVVNHENYKYIYKVKTPEKIGETMISGKMFIVLVVPLSMIEFKKGRAGDQHEFYLGLASDLNFDLTENYKLDFETTNPTAQASTYDENDLDTDFTGTYTTSSKWLKRMTVFFRSHAYECDRLLDRIVKNIDKAGKLEYKFVWKEGTEIATYTVLITSSNMPIIRTDMDMITFTIELAGDLDVQ